MLRRNAEPEEVTVAEMPATAFQEFDIVLKPLSQPDLPDIRIEEDLFAVGRTEPPFESYAPELVADLSRRHAKIFAEHGAVYIADLDSKNGTTVNGIGVQQKITRLRDGDEICFGGTLSYRVQLRPRTDMARLSPRAGTLLSLTLTPERDDLGLQPIVVTQFPFLISKADDTFSRYKEAFPHQVNYISRRHAHIFLKGGAPFVEDLGSTNGTFVAGNRLDEHAVPLNDGDVLAFGGHHFVYKLSVQQEEQSFDPTMTKLSPAALRAANAPGDADKTTFVEAADSFLDIFCVDQGQRQDDEVNSEGAKQAETHKEPGEKPPRSRSRSMVFASELASAFAGSDRTGLRRLLRWGGALIVLLVALAFLLRVTSAPERTLKDKLASGDAAQAATLASSYLERDPDNAEIKALGTEALLKAYVPPWAASVKARDFGRASATVAAMKALARNNANAQPLIAEIEWIGNIEGFVMGRGGPDAPIRIYADEDKVRSLLKQWDDDTPGHQRSFATISSIVPDFKDVYAEALSHLRKLQSDDAVYLAAIERLKTNIGSALNRDQPEVLEPVLKDYAEKYPRLGLDGVRQDLKQYLAIETEARARRVGPLAALIAQAKFATPPFQQKFRALLSSDRLPPPSLMQQIQSVSGAWRAGNTTQAIDGLQKMNAGPWADALGRELERKKTVAGQFSSLQKSRDAKGYDERLLSFYGTLDPAEDEYFIRAVDADIGLYKTKAIARANDSLNQAQARWTQYRENGGIEGERRLESTISNSFRTQARLLSEAQSEAQQGVRILAQLKTEQPAQWSKLSADINAEADLQRKSLLDLRMVLEPGVLKAKLALLAPTGGRGDEDRK